jgi:exodeoxyribonuclease-3
VSWNVNGIRAACNKGFIDWLEQTSPDIIGLQEIKAEKNQFPEKLLENSAYNFFISSAEKKGYSGVAVLSKQKPLKVIDKLGIEKFDREGRTIICEYKAFVFINCYFPNGQRDHARVDYKLEFYAEILKLYKSYIKEGKKVIITGDFNTAHTEIDLANPKSNKNTTGFLEHERVWIDKYLKAGMIDALRFFEPNTKGIYSWWTYRSDCRSRNIGWRIDYFMVSESLKSKLKSCRHLTDIMGSDHCPIELVLK